MSLTAQDVLRALSAIEDPDLHRDRSLGSAVGGKRVLITGASSGIGRAAARKIGAAGGIVILVARSADKLREVQTDRDVAAYESMRAALLSLPQRQRAAIVLRYYEDLHESQIADLLRCRPATVRSLVARGLEALRKIPEVTT